MHTHEDYMKEALVEARKALLKGEFPVGCVMVYQGEIVSRGRRTNSRPPNQNEIDHAEISALRHLFAAHPGIDRSGITVYSTMEPCLMCYATLLLNDIRSIVYGYEDIMGGGTSLALEELPPLYRDMQVNVTPHVRRRECLELFKNFFEEQDNIYWRDSELAGYTINQIRNELEK